MNEKDRRSLIKQIKQLNYFGNNCQCIGFDDAKREIIELVKKFPKNN